ncbi:hypothetical protein [Shewanella sp. UCD-FRSSP16_17]|uniref:hypothetical protein n=1 Tax=Shewanella sp. UCD-FRSSP16_17 TaxID=1853256 RepID=UPI0012E7B286|nr:hypothetical protein [Shewanella sp. UCD-FRSSP16_17]
MQQMFYVFINANLFNSKGLNAEFSPASERHSALRKKMKAEARQPKHQRPFNFHTRKVEYLQQQVIDLKKEHQSITHTLSDSEQTLARLKIENRKIHKQNIDWQQKIVELQSEYKQLRVKHDNIRNVMEQGQVFIREQASVRDQLDVEVNKLTQAAKVKQKEVIKLGEEIGKREAVLARLKELTNQAILPIQCMIKKFMMRFGSKGSSAENFYFNRVIDVFDDSLSPEYRDISIGITKALNDDKLESALIKKNKKLMKNSLDYTYK